MLPQIDIFMELQNRLMAASDYLLMISGFLMIQKRIQKNLE